MSSDTTSDSDSGTDSESETSFDPSEFSNLYDAIEAAAEEDQPYEAVSTTLDHFETDFDDPEDIPEEFGVPNIEDADELETTLEAKIQPAEPADPLATDFAIGDPVIDLATGRTVVIVDHVANRTDKHSEREDYEFLENYGNSRLRANASDPVYEVVYVNSLQSKPSKSYDFPSSRLGRPTYEKVEGVRRVYDRVALDVLKRLFATGDNHDDELELDSLELIAKRAGLGASTIDEARELADVETNFGGSE